MLGDEEDMDTKAGPWWVIFGVAVFGVVVVWVVIGFFKFLVELLGEL